MRQNIGSGFDASCSGSYRTVPEPLVNDASLDQCCHEPKKKRVAEMSATQTSSHSSYTRSPTSKWLKRVKRDTTCCSRPLSTAVHSVGLVSPSLLQLLSDNGFSMPSVTLQQFPCSGYEEEVALGLDAPFFLCCREQLLAKFRCETGQSTNPNAPDTQKLAWHKRQEGTPECDGTRR